MGVCPGTPKRGVLGAGTAQKGGLRCGHSPKKGVLGAGTTRKRGVLDTSTARKRGICELIYLLSLFLLVNVIN